MDDKHFYKNNKNGIDGYSSRCIECEKKRATQWRKDNRERWLEIRRNRNQKPEVKKQMRKDAKASRERGVQKRWQEENPERVRELSKNHRNHDITTTEWNNELRVFDYKCAYCDISEEEAKKRDKQNLHKDHIDSEGYNDIRNAAPACRGCNDTKWTFDMETWFREQPFFSKERLNKIIWWCTEGYKDYIEDKPPYRISRERVYNEDGSWNFIHTLWTVDEQRNMVKCIAKGKKKRDLDVFIKEHYKN